MQNLKAQRVFEILLSIFCAIVVVSNILSVKMIRMPLGMPAIPSGLIFYPLTFFLASAVTEIFGKREAKQMVLIALAMNGLSLLMIQFILILPSTSDDSAFREILGTSGLRIFASMAAYITAQMVEIKLYAFLKTVTKPNSLWQRLNGATFISQAVDTLLIDLIFFYWGLAMSLEQLLPIVIFSYSYKILFSIINTPLFYLTVYLIRKRVLSNQALIDPLAASESNSAKG